MSEITIKVSKMSDAEKALPGFRAIWKTIKEVTRTTQRGPKSLRFSDQAQSLCLNDGECARRFALDLATMELSERSFHVSSGEWACHAGSNNDEEVRGVPNGFALLDCIWNDYYRYFSIRVQVAPGAIPAQLNAA